jgi:hypothetical protein
MSEIKSVCRSCAWSVSYTLYASLQQDAALQLRPPSTVQPLTLFWNLFHALFQRGPDTIFYIHVRVSRGEFDQCVACGSSGSALPNLPFTAVIQASDRLYLSKLQSFLPDAEWTPVGGKLCSDQRAAAGCCKSLAFCWKSSRNFFSRSICLLSLAMTAIGAP